MKIKKKAIWQILIDRGLFEDRSGVTKWIMAGKVFVGSQRVDNAGEKVSEDADIRVKGYDLKYVGKGGIKLEAALETFNLDISNKVCLDTGASTGGFTDCLLQSGAKKVYAIDVGYGQLSGKLRINNKVVNMEKRNIGDVTRYDLDILPDFATVDLSYLSLKKAIPIIEKLMKKNGEMLCLVKPLFEVEDLEIRRKGNIENISDYEEVLHNLVKFVEEERNLTSLGITNSKITGNKGTREFFMWLSLDPTKKRKNLEEDIRESVLSAINLPLYKKVLE